MRVVPHACMASLLLAASCLAHAQVPVIEFGAVASTGGEVSALLDTPLEAAGELLQVRLSPGVVLSAARGARLALLRQDAGDAGTLVIVLREPVMAVDTAGNRVAALGLGGHFVRDGRPDGDWVVRVPPRGAERGGAMAGQAPLLGDGIMVRQQAYLDSLRIDVQPINRAVAAFIRRLLPVPGR